MIILLKKGYDREELDELVGFINGQGLTADISAGRKATIVGVIGDTSKLDIDRIKAMKIVETAQRVQEPYKLASRKFHPKNTVVDVCGRKFGEKFQIIAGPCSIESGKQITGIAKAVKKAGATALRGGAFKPRTSPYAFQGMREDGLPFLVEAKRQTGLPIVSEIMDARDLDKFKDVDVLQIGARNMQNFELLKAVGKTDKPVLIKRGFANTIEEWLLSAEYVLSGGNKNVILCERGIRTFETATKNTLDISAVPVIKEKSHLPVIVDPSHATGSSSLVLPMALAAAAAGADGVMLEVHDSPEDALSDGLQAQSFSEFGKTVRELHKVLKAIGRETE